LDSGIDYRLKSGSGNKKIYFIKSKDATNDVNRKVLKDPLSNLDSEIDYLYNIILEKTCNIVII